MRGSVPPYLDLGDLDLGHGALWSCLGRVHDLNVLHEALRVRLALFLIAR